ncbi:cytochrome P450 81Q32-like [Apium graveolens]|uniref:cytochrome P450 81Q32-like n=1 Tax=Apium graveolens TaxID=4045 RepID=UPI003D7A6011
MDPNMLLYVALSILLILFVSKLLKKSIHLPPSPFPRLPIIGHLYLIKEPLHRTLDALSKTIGPVLSLRFGSFLVVVVSSPAAVEECFTKNDIVLANRPRLILGEHMGYNWSTMVSVSYGDNWRNLRRLSAHEIFSTSRLNSFLSMRRDEVNQLLHGLSQNTRNEFGKVVLKPNLTDLAFNIIMRMIAGKRYYGEVVHDNEEAKHVRDVIEEVLSMAGASYPGDFLPFLSWIDYKNFKKRAFALFKKMDKLLQGIIEEHKNGEARNSMVAHLLSLQKSEPDSYSDIIIKGLMVVLIFAGSDTSGVTIEWAMTLLLNHPHVLKKARDEIDTVIGQDRLVEESDLSKLTYLHNIILETFRLFPATPLLLPHQASADCKVGGYDIPAGTLVLVNSWSIHRDPKVWDDPTSFKPERFEGIEVETHKLMPFGMGRRSCPGNGLAHRVVGLVLASLIQCFDWERISDEQIDLTEGKGLTMPKAEPLEAMCKTRSVIHKVNI